MNRSYSQRGIAHVGVYVILAVVALAVGAGGYYVYRSNQHQEASSMEAAVYGNEQKQAAANRAQDDYVVIREWGIRFKIPSARKLTYKITADTVANGSDEPAAHFYLKSPYAAYADCQDLGKALVRSTTPPSKNDAPITRHFGGYYYQFDGGAYSCVAGRDINPTVLNQSRADIDDQELTFTTSRLQLETIPNN